MKPDTASRTAQYMALFRALETVRSPNERLFTDPYAISFLDGKLRMITRLSRFPVVRKYVQSTIQKKIPGALSSGLARTKYIDDILRKTIQKGVEQLIILGAGFDTRGIRLDFLRSMPIIEIDHPDTSKLKSKRLKSRLGRLPENVRYLQMDFNNESLEDLAAGNSIDFLMPAAIIWEGVTNYLTAEAIENTFRFVQKFAKGSYIIFTYVHRKVLDDPGAFRGGIKLLEDLESIGERWTFGFNPEELPGYLHQFDLLIVEDSGASQYREKYLPDRKENGYEFYRVAFAEKK